MDVLVDKYIQQAITGQGDGRFTISYADLDREVEKEIFDENLTAFNWRLFLDMLSARPEFDRMESTQNEIYLTVSPEFVQEQAPGIVYVKGDFLMKKGSITIPYDEEKVGALRLYLEQKGQSVEQEMGSAVDALYTKTVPGNIREFLDLCSGMEVKPAEKRKRPRPQAEQEPAPVSVPESSDSF